MLSRKKALDDGAGELSLLALIAWVSTFDLANARATCRFWLDDIPMVRYPHTCIACRSFALPCSWVENDRIGGTFLDLTLMMCCADHWCFSCAPAGCIG